jgi:hypothetical protein
MAGGGYSTPNGTTTPAPENAGPRLHRIYVKHPAGAVHWDGAKDEEVVLQIVGEGPVTTDLVKKDGPMFRAEK